MPIRDTSDAGGFGFLDPMYIYGSQDAVQLTVRGHSTQTNYLQRWETSAAALRCAVGPTGQIFSENPFSVPVDEVNRFYAYRYQVADFGADFGLYGGNLDVGIAQSGSPHGLRLLVTDNHPAGNINIIHALYFQVTKGNVAGTVSNIEGIRGWVQNLSTTAPTYMIGASFLVLHQNTGWANECYGVQSGLNCQAGGGIWNGIGYYCQSPTTAGGGFIANLYGLKIDDQIVGTSLNYAIYTGGGPVHFGDNTEIVETETLTGNVADDYAAGLALDPGYTGGFGVTRHNYIDVQDVSVAGGATVTAAPVMRFDAAIGTHKSLPAAFTTADDQGHVTNWAGGLLININGTLYKIPFIAA